jgi:alanyl-tRNA synthetase
VGHTGDIGLFKIISESGVASGVRRIEAVAGEVAWNYFQMQLNRLQESSFILKTSPELLTQKLKELVAQNKLLNAEVDHLKRSAAQGGMESLIASAQSMGDVRWIAHALSDVDAKSMREMQDELKKKLSPAVIVLGSCKEGKVNLIVGVSDALTHRVRAGELINFIAEQVGGKGGGRADMAQAGGTLPEQLPQALASVSDWLQKKLAE